MRIYEIGRGLNIDLSRVLAISPLMGFGDIDQKAGFSVWLEGLQQPLKIAEGFIFKDDNEKNSLAAEYENMRIALVRAWKEFHNENK